MPNFVRAALVVAISATLYGGCKKSHGGGAALPPVDPFVSSTGALDPTFDGDGKVSTPVGLATDVGNGVAIQADGKIVVAGKATLAAVDNFAVLRYNSDGSPDSTFGTAGIMTTLMGTSGGANAVAIQADGKIVVAGSANSGANNDFALARYTSAGALDTTFNTTGKVLTDIAAGQDLGFGVAIQGDGKIVAAGWAVNGGNYDFAVARYNSDGSLDLGFDGDGKQTTDISGGNDFCNSVAIQGDGKIVLAGDVTGGNFAVVRYTSAGALDTTFNAAGTPGKVTTSIGAGYDSGQSVVIQGDGRIVVAGYSDAGGGIDQFALVRYNSDGTLDTTFDGDGIATTTFGFNGAEASAAAIQPDGRIVVCGSYQNGVAAVVLVARYNADGSLDATFDGDGFATAVLGTSTWNIGNAVAVQPDGGIVVAGSGNNGFDDDIFVVRWHLPGVPFVASTGALDTTFSGDGKTNTLFGTNSVGQATVIQPNGKILAAGYSYTGANDDFAVARYNADGSPDTSFNSTGTVTTAIGAANEEAFAIALQVDGKIVVAGQAHNGTNFDFAIVRYNADGSLDTTFNSTGTVTTAIGASDDHARAVAIQTDGKIVAAGPSFNGGVNDFAVVRYNANGSLDTTFNTIGKVVTPIGTGDSQAFSMALQVDGRIVVAGQAQNGLYDEFAVVRYNLNGVLDSTFNTNGKVTTSVGANDDYGRAVLVQPGGKIVVAGYAYNGVGDDFALVRYTSAGVLDTSFNTTGKVISSFGFNGSECFSLALQPDGRFIAAGGYYTGSVYVGLVARYTTAGSLDLSFDGDGFVTTALGSGSYDLFSGVALQADGRIVAVGQGYVAGAPNLFVVRYK